MFQIRAKREREVYFRSQLLNILKHGKKEACQGVKGGQHHWRPFSGEHLKLKFCSKKFKRGLSKQMIDLESGMIAVSIRGGGSSGRKDRVKKHDASIFLLQRKSASARNF